MNSPKLPADLLEVLASMDDVTALERLLGDLLTYNEVESLQERWEIVKLLAAGHSQRTIRDALGVSVTTVSRGSKQLKYGEGGFALAFDALSALGHGDPRHPAPTGPNAGDAHKEAL